MALYIRLQKQSLTPSIVALASCMGREWARQQIRSKLDSLWATTRGMPSAKFVCSFLLWSPGFACCCVISKNLTRPDASPARLSIALMGTSHEVLWACEISAPLD